MVSYAHAIHFLFAREDEPEERPLRDLRHCNISGSSQQMKPALKEQVL